MMENTLVYHGAHAPIEELLDHAIKNPVRLDARDVEVVEAARAVEGEVWSPQLPAYRAWAAEGEAGDVAGGAGREGDLYSAGALWMGEFDELLAQAAERDAADAQETPRARMEEGLRGAVGVRQVPGGYALTAFDLRRGRATIWRFCCPRTWTGSPWCAWPWKRSRAASCRAWGCCFWWCPTRWSKSLRTRSQRCRRSGSISGAA